MSWSEGYKPRDEIAWAYYANDDEQVLSGGDAVEAHNRYSPVDR